MPLRAHRAGLGLLALLLACTHSANPPARTPPARADGGGGGHNPMGLALAPQVPPDQWGQWLGIPLREGEWYERASGWLITGHRAKVGEHYRIAVQGQPGTDPHLCVMTGTAEEADLDDAVPLLRTCPKADASGLSAVDTTVSAGSNALWFTLQGEPGPPVRIRFDRSDPPAVVIEPQAAPASAPPR